jgi:hypothetical protein
MGNGTIRVLEVEVMIDELPERVVELLSTLMRRPDVERPARRQLASGNQEV